jgi:hypothetical protein
MTWALTSWDIKPTLPAACEIVFQIKRIFDVPLVIVGGKHPVHEGLVVINV